MHDPTEPADPDNRARLPWGVNKTPPLEIHEEIRDVRVRRDEDHARLHPISDSGVQQHSILTTTWEPNRPMAPFTGDLVKDTFERPSYAVVVVCGLSLTGIIVIITWLIVLFRGGL